VPISPAILTQQGVGSSSVPHWGKRVVQGNPSRASLPSAIPALDELFGGGLPWGAITEVIGGISSGRTTLAHVMASAATRAGEFVAWVDLSNALDPNCAERAGVDLERVLWVYPTDRRAAFRAVEQVLGAGGFRLVVLDLDGPLPSASTWLRMGRAAVHRDAAIVVLSSTRIPGTFATLSLEACANRRVFVGESGPCPVFEGGTSFLYLRKSKYGPSCERPVELFASTGA
jgi:hypothetical protein